MTEHVHLLSEYPGQEGYGVLSLREGDVDKVSKCIDNQEDLHRRRKLSRLLETLEGT